MESDGFYEIDIEDETYHVTLEVTRTDTQFGVFIGMCRL